MGEQSGKIGNERVWFWGLLALAVALRAAAFNPYAIHNSDETIQYLEQAHRIVFGYGIVPWEFRYFIRSWLIPLLLVPPMQLGEWINPGGTLYLILARAAVAIFNLAPVVAAWMIGRRTSVQHAIVAMAVMATWVECVLFSVQTLSESMAVSCFFIAVALLRPEARIRTIVAAGAMMALAGIMRFQFGPAIAVYGLLVAGRDWRMWKGLLIGGGAVVIAGGVLDLIMGLMPYQWILTNYRMNIAEGKMARIAGPGSHWVYAQAIMAYWGPALLVIPFLVALTWKRYWPLLAAAAVNLLIHQLIGHKEYRYIWLSMQIILLVAAIGSIELLRLLPERRRFDPRGKVATLALVALWSLASLLLASQQIYRDGWRNSGGPARLAAETLADPKVCGLAVPRREYPQFGYSLLHRPKPLFLLGREADNSLLRPGAAGAGFNAVLSWAELPPPQGFPLKGPCAGGPGDRACVYRRAGGCSVDGRSRPYLYQETLNQHDM